MTLENHSSACSHKLLRGRRNGGCTELAVLFVNKDKRTLVGYGVTNYIVQVSCLAHCDSAAECSSHSPWPTPSRPRRMWSLTAHPPGRVRIGSTGPPARKTRRVSGDFNKQVDVWNAQFYSKILSKKINDNQPQGRCTEIFKKSWGTLKWFIDILQGASRRLNMKYIMLLTSETHPCTLFGVFCYNILFVNTTFIRPIIDTFDSFDW